jgi:hypothetical protein
VYIDALALDRGSAKTVNTTARKEESDNDGRQKTSKALFIHCAQR